MDQKRKENQSIDWIYTFKHICRFWWLILAFAMAAANVVYIWKDYTYQPQFQTSAIFTVSSQSIDAGILADVSSAKTTAGTFSLLLDTSVMKNKIIEAVGENSAATTYSVNLVPETNMLELKVCSDSPLRAYKTMKAILGNYDKVTDAVMGDVYLKILQSPVLSEKPINSFNGLKTYASTAVITALVLCFVIGLLSTLRDTVRSEEDLQEKIDAPALGVIYHDKSGNRMGQIRKKNANPMLISNSMLRLSFVESTKLVASALREQMEKMNVKTVMVTSSSTNEGKTTVAANLAISLAKEKKNVLLIDWDFRKPSLFRLLGVKQEILPHVEDYLLGREKEPYPIMYDPRHRLYLALNGKATYEAGDWVTKDFLSMIISSLDEKPDYVIVDTAPISLVSDTLIIAPFVDAAVIVAHQDYVPARVINDIIDTLTEAGTPVIGCVLNNVHSFGLTARYGGDYGRYQ